MSNLFVGASLQMSMNLAELNEVTQHAICTVTVVEYSNHSIIHVSTIL